MPKNLRSSLELARLRGAQIAARELSSLGTNLGEPVDIFSIMRGRDIDVMFRPLDALYGACLFDGDSAGVLINVKHPPNLQRFTAAHEYGHFIMKHGSCLDEEEQILPNARRYSSQEVEAQTFAARFLMPTQLVNTLLHQMGLSLKPGRLSPEQVYQLSLRLGVSYTAVVTQLLALGKINQSSARELQSDTPKAIKAAIGRGLRPQNSWADVWVFDEQDHGKKFSVYVDDELHLYLPETLSSDEGWKLISIQEIASLKKRGIFSTDADSSMLKIISTISEMDMRVGVRSDLQGRYVRHIVLRTTVSGDVSIRLEKRAGFPPAQSTSLFELTLRVLSRPRPGPNSW